MTASPEQIQQIFLKIIALPADQRGAALERECGDRPAVRQRVAALLARNDEADSFLDQTGAAFDATIDSEPVVNANDRSQLVAGVMIANRYTLRDKIGEGGMGEVWVAKQSEPVKRRVALKVIKCGMDSEAVLARFEQERQTLALMDHPNIARVLDGGMTSGGQPFFVMELVNGQPLDAFCDSAQLSLSNRLELFVPICQAVQHAHQKGIVHRDLKPANILVTMIDGRPVPKVIDFGLAKAFAGNLSEETMTRFGMVVGTLEYMSPEQAVLSGSDIDTRADIYSLGVILYELLTGLRPIARARLEKAAIMEMIRIIREEEPAKPSQRLSSENSLPSLAAERQTEPHRLMALLRGELDWVVMKCLSKDRERRYATATGLVRDIQRYLANEPVEARPPTAGYRLHKFLKRNKGAAIATSLLLVTLLAGIMGTTWGLITARAQQRLTAQRAQGEHRAKREAEDKRAQAERATVHAREAKLVAEMERRSAEQAQNRAEQEKRVAQAVRDFLQVKLLGQADVTAQANALLQAGRPASEVQQNPTIRELLDRAAEELSEDNIEQNFPNQPLLQAEILDTIGNTYHGVGEYDRAIAFLERAFELRKRHLGPEQAETLESMDNLAAAYQIGKQYAKALALVEKTFALVQAKLGPEDPQTISTMNTLATSYMQSGQYREARGLYEKSLEFTTAHFGPEHPTTLLGLNNLATALRYTNRYAEALSLFEQIHQRQTAKLGPDHPDTLQTQNNVASTLLTLGMLDKALPLLETTFRLRKAKLGLDHPQTLSTMNMLAGTYKVAGQLDQALALIDETLTLQKAKLGPEHPDTIYTANQVAATYLTLGEREKTSQLLNETLAVAKTHLGSEHRMTLLTTLNLAGSYTELRQFEKALPLSQEYLVLARSQFGHKHHQTLAGQRLLASIYAQSGQFDKGLPLFEQTLALSQAEFGNDHPHTLITMNVFAKAYASAGQYDKALPLYEQTLALEKAKFGPEHPHLLEAMNEVAIAYMSARQFDKSLQLFEETLALKKAKLGLEHPNTIGSMHNLAQAYTDTGRPAQAIPLFEQMLEITKAKFGPQHGNTLGAMYSLARAYQAAGEPAKAVPLLKELLKRKLGPQSNPRPSPP